MSHGIRILGVPPKYELSPIDLLFERISLEELKNYEYISMDENSYRKMKNSSLFIEENGLWKRDSMILNGKSFHNLSFSLFHKTPFAENWYVSNLQYGRDFYFEFSHCDVGRGVFIFSRLTLLK